MRKTTRYPVEGANSLWQVYKTVSFWKVCQKYHRHRTGPIYTLYGDEKLALPGIPRNEDWRENSPSPYMVMPDVMFPEKISVGRNTVIGYNTTILAHEYLIKEYRLGPVEIGNEVMIGANSTILPGITIGDGAIVSAGTLVHKDVPPGYFVGGNPMRVIYTKEELVAQRENDPIYSVNICKATTVK